MSDCCVNRMCGCTCAEIMDGNVMFLNNNLLCYENTVNWKDILTGENSEVMHHRSSRDMTRECEPTL